ncbi:hypothetical protein BU26DRAFT_537047 [Trematosphaeria pertusa]|uniref:Uncharacterized protein n=1 Tax=Trematosphaeria pertusa TaxID=390896 RepID=A0A6A6J4F2_9PLEO|nr:uncharacterized protein BU26DRAFT_537047 [Trematosphaeria pertusa]KAF2257247.1 hypothetical protein BU26DRAFT_537047 [Trematosphaeria pertusa]
MPSSFRLNATVNEARAASGHTKEQWDRFYFITKEETRQLSEAHQDWTRWILIPANEKERMLARINGRLTAEGIPAVDMDILKWRVSQLLRDIQRRYANNIECLAEGSMISGMGGSSSGTQTQTQAQPEASVQSPQRTDSSPSESRPYDPIRDV